MKKFILNIVKFLGFLIPSYIILLFIWSFFMPQFMAKNVRNKIAPTDIFLRECKKLKLIKILIFFSLVRLTPTEVLTQEFSQKWDTQH